MNRHASDCILRIDDGIASVRFAWGGPGVNPFDLNRLESLATCWRAAAARGDVDVIILESDHPGGFSTGVAPGLCEQLSTPDDRTAFSRRGQALLTELSTLEAVTVAWIAGPCVGPALELALACDYRLATASAASWLGFTPGWPTAWGGAARLGANLNRSAQAWWWQSGERFTAKEAVAQGVIDDAVSARRAKIERRRWLDRLQARPHQHRRAAPATALAAERAAFRIAPLPPPDTPAATPLPTTIYVDGSNPFGAQVAVEAALRGRAVTLAGGRHLVDAAFAEAARRGRMTPLERAQAEAQIVAAAEDTIAADWVILSQAPAHRVAAGAVVTVGPEPLDPSPAVRERVAGWCAACGVAPPQPVAPPRLVTAPLQVRAAA